MYKEMMKEDRKLATFVRQCTMNPLCKKKGIPECILFVTQRITKYPLLIDPLIKTSRDQPDECLKLQQVLAFVKVGCHLFLFRLVLRCVLTPRRPLESSSRDARSRTPLAASFGRTKCTSRNCKTHSARLEVGTHDLERHWRPCSVVESKL